MNQFVNVVSWACTLGIARLATSAFVGGSDFLGRNSTMSFSTQNPVTNPFAPTIYGKSKCPCVGIDNLEGYYATNMDFYHLQYPLEAGSSCFPWELDVHPYCSGGGGPPWCYENWCYVDPCNCELGDIGESKAGVMYQGGPAYWSYNTCGFTDLYSQSMNQESCVFQKNESSCEALKDRHGDKKCAWDSEGDLWNGGVRGSRSKKKVLGQCGGITAVKTCKGANAAMSNDQATYGQEGCQCIGLDGRTPGTAYLWVSNEDQIKYPPGVGATCSAWESTTHPDCLRDGETPEWCEQKWCFVDPCKCSTAIPPKMVMEANRALRFQGKTAFWSAETCGSVDTWSKAHAEEYCITQTSEEDCKAHKSKAGLPMCGWTGTQCLGEALVSICQKQKETGILGFEAFSGGSLRLRSFTATFLLLVGALAVV